MDKATEYLIIQEAHVSKLVSSLKTILPNVQSALKKGNVNMMKKIAQRLPRKKIKDIERQAIRQIPGFKEKYADAQRKIARSREFEQYTAKPAAISVALISSTTNNTDDDIIKKGIVGVRQAKILPIPGYFDLIKVGLFISFIASVYITDGAIILPTIQLAIKSMISLLSLLSSILDGIAGSGSVSKTGMAKTMWNDFWAKSFERPKMDASVADKITQMANPIPNQLMSAHDSSQVTSMLFKIDPLGLK